MKRLTHSTVTLMKEARVPSASNSHRLYRIIESALNGIGDSVAHRNHSRWLCTPQLRMF